MDNSIIQMYADILEQCRAVTFEHNETIYRIWENDEGWYLQLLNESDDVFYNDEGEISSECPFVESDGGLCTGSALDAIEFML